MRTSAHAHTYARNHTQSHTRTHKYARAHTYAPKMPLRAQRAPARAFRGLFTHNNPQQIAKSAYGRRAARPLARCAERMRGAAANEKGGAFAPVGIARLARFSCRPSPSPPPPLPSPPPPLIHSLPRSICLRPPRSLRSSLRLHQPPPHSRPASGRGSAVRRNKAQQGATRHNKAQQGATRHNKAQQGAPRHNKAQQRAPRHNKAQQGATRHKKTLVCPDSRRLPARERCLRAVFAAEVAGASAANSSAARALGR